MSKNFRRFAPLLAAAVIGVVVWYGAWILVASDYAARAGDHGREGRHRILGFVGFFTVLAACIAFIVTRRVLRGPEMAQRDWALWLHPDAAQHTVSALLARLEHYGWRPKLIAGAPGDALFGAEHILSDEAFDPRTRVTLSISAEGAIRSGYLVCSYRAEGEEECPRFAMFTMLALSDLSTNATFKSASSLEAPMPIAELRDYVGAERNAYSQR